MKAGDRFTSAMYIRKRNDPEDVARTAATASLHLLAELKQSLQASHVLILEDVVLADVVSSGNPSDLFQTLATFQTFEGSSAKQQIVLVTAVCQEKPPEPKDEV